MVLLPRKGLTLPPYPVVAHGCSFYVLVKSILRCIRIAYAKNQVEGNKRNQVPRPFKYPLNARSNLRDGIRTDVASSNIYRIRM